MILWVTHSSAGSKIPNSFFFLLLVSWLGENLSFFSTLFFIVLWTSSIIPSTDKRLYRLISPGHVHTKRPLQFATMTSHCIFICVNHLIRFPLRQTCKCSTRYWSITFSCLRNRPVIATKWLDGATHLTQYSQVNTVAKLDTEFRTVFQFE